MAFRALFRVELLQAQLERDVTRLLSGTPRPPFRLNPMRLLRDGEEALRSGRFEEAAAHCEDYLSTTGGLGSDPSAEMVVRRLAFLYSRLGRVSESAREYERLRSHYLEGEPPDTKKAQAAQTAAARLHRSAQGLGEEARGRATRA